MHSLDPPDDKMAQQITEVISAVPVAQYEAAAAAAKEKAGDARRRAEAAFSATATEAVKEVDSVAFRAGLGVGMSIGALLVIAVAAVMVSVFR